MAIKKLPSPPRESKFTFGDLALQIDQRRQLVLVAPKARKPVKSIATLILAEQICRQGGVLTRDEALALVRSPECYKKPRQIYAGALWQIRHSLKLWGSDLAVEVYPKQGCRLLEPA